MIGVVEDQTDRDEGSSDVQLAPAGVRRVRVRILGQIRGPQVRVYDYHWM